MRPGSSITSTAVTGQRRPTLLTCLTPNEDDDEDEEDEEDEEEMEPFITATQYGTSTLYSAQHTIDDDCFFVSFKTFYMVG